MQSLIINSLIYKVFIKSIIITKDVYIVDKFNISNHNKLFFWSQNSNKNSSLPISNNMYVTRQIIDEIKFIVLKTILLFPKKGFNQTLWFVRINIVMLKKKFVIFEEVKMKDTC